MAGPVLPVLQPGASQGGAIDLESPSKALSPDVARSVAPPCLEDEKLRILRDFSSAAYRQHVQNHVYIYMYIYIYRNNTVNTVPPVIMIRY